MKRQRENSPPVTSGALTVTSRTENALTTTAANKKRLSTMSQEYYHFADVHTSDVLSVQYSPSGHVLASCSVDSRIQLFCGTGEVAHIGSLQDSLPILDIDWCGNEFMFSGNSGGSVSLWDVASESQHSSSQVHDGVVNDVATYASSALVISAGDDKLVNCCDVRVSASKKSIVKSFELPYPTTCVCVHPSGEFIFAGDISGRIYTFDFSAGDLISLLPGHTNEIITSLTCTAGGNQLLSNGMDGTIKVWDVRPFVQEGNELLWNGAGNIPCNVHVLRRASMCPRTGIIGAGSGVSPYDVLLWKGVESTKVSTEPIARLSGHSRVVASVDFHPYEPVIASGSLDGSIIVGEFEI
eukprot:PhF_6_TR43665/c0_g1_i1/m.67099/K12857/SNRNP40, PRP8BP; Prp8 binding protein